MLANFLKKQPCNRNLALTSASECFRLNLRNTRRTEGPNSRRSGMNRQTILAALMLCASLTARSSAITVDFTLTIDVSTHSWTLSSATDAIGGIGAFAVELGNIPSGTSVAPRSVFNDIPVRGFTVGNNFSEYPQPPLPA